jgi:hypothetical protein
MPALSINVPFPVFQDRDGQPLDNGYVYIGTPYLDPQTNPVQVYFDEALTILAAQPLRTINGYVSNAGTPAQLYVNGVNFSIKVLDSKANLVYSFPDGSGISPNASGVQYDPAGAGAVSTNVQAKLREIVSVKDFGAICDGVTDDTAFIQTAINYCVSNQKDLFIPGMSLITASLNIDRLVDSSAADNYFTIFSMSGGGIVVNSAIAMFSTTLVNPSDPNLPVSQMIRFSGLIFESTNSAISAYVLDQNKFLRVLFESCNFRKIKCLNAPAGKLTQTITFQNCQARRWSGTFFKSDEATFDLKVLGGLWEAGGDGFDIDFPVGTAFIGANIEGMAVFAIKYTGGYALTVQGCYFEENGNNNANGCSIDGSAGTGGAGSEAVSIIGNYFSGDTDTPSKPQIKWGDDVTAVSTGNLCSTTLHQFGTNSRVNIVSDYARTAISTNDATSYNGIKNDLQIGSVFRAESNYTYGGIIRASFVGGSGGFLRLRSLQNKVESSTGLDIDDNGNVNITGNGSLAGYIDISEISTASLPAANKARLYTRDNGSGKTQLVVQFPTGSAQVISTEP